MEMIKKNEWVVWDSCSGKLTNPGKTFYLNISASVIREVRNQKYKDGLSYIRKDMIVFGVALSINGKWEVCKFLRLLQKIVKKYPENFQDMPVAEILKLGEEVKES